MCFRPRLGCDIAVQKYALLVGICYSGKERLIFPHQDVDKMRDMLIKVYGYLPGNIIVMKDSDEVSEDLRPTKANLERVISSFIRRDQKNAEYFFHYGGHSGQQEAAPDDYSEEDGLDEYIITSDDGLILDNDLNEWLVQPILKLKTSRLWAVIDACYSGTLLDLEHHRCNRVCKLTSVGRRIIRRINEDVVNLFAPQQVTPSTFLVDPRKNLPATLEKDHVLGVPCRYCRRLKGDAGRVVCISASKDAEKAYEDKEGQSMSMDIVELLNHEKNMSLKKLMRALYARRVKQNREMAKAKSESFKLQHPQLSSDVPLDVNLPFLCSSS